MAKIKGGKVFFDGQEYVEMTTLVKGPLAAGSHDLGTIKVPGIGTVPMSIAVGKNGRVTRIELTWPPKIRPKLLYRKTHSVAMAAQTGGGSTTHPTGTAHEHCEMRELPIIRGDKIVGHITFWKKIIVVHPW